MTSHLDSHKTTDIKPEMLSGVQTGNGTPHGIYNKRSIAHACTNRKNDIFMHRRLVQNFAYIMEGGQGTCTLTKRTQRCTYSALQHFFYQTYEILPKNGINETALGLQGMPKDTDLFTQILSKFNLLCLLANKRL